MMLGVLFREWRFTGQGGDMEMEMGWLRDK